MSQQWDALVIGAGPAGMSAAAVMAERGLQVTLVDEQETPGGQIYRGVTRPLAATRFAETKDYNTGLTLTRRFLASGARYLPRTTVWFVEPGRVLARQGDATHEILATRIIIAVGAMERPVPFKGWTLPGVMGVGAAHILQKTSGITPAGPLVLAGSGPLLPMAAAHYLEQGVPLAAILDTTPITNLVRAVPFFLPALADSGLLWRGMGYMLTITQKHVPVYTGVTGLTAEGADHVERVRFLSRGKEHTLDAKTLLWHNGVIARTHMAASADLKHAWSHAQQCWNTCSDESGHTSRNGIMVAGDCAGVHGAEASALQGELTGLTVAAELGALGQRDAKLLARPLRQKLWSRLAARPFVDAVFRPNARAYASLDDDVVVCRCENVTAGEIRAVVAEGVLDVNEIKLRLRPGMGPCQGRMCGPALAFVAAAAAGVPARKLGMLRIRPPLRPVPLATLCTMTHDN